MNQAILYSKYNSLQKTDVNFVLENYLRLINWRENDAILDVGCGSGDVTTKLLLPRIPCAFKQLVGVDLSEEMVKFAASQCAHPNVSFYQMNIERKDIPESLEESFQHIFSFYALHWIQEQRQAFENLYKMLKPGGDMLLTFLASNPIFHIYENLASNTKWMEYMKNAQKFINPYQHCEHPDQILERLLQDVGFSIHLCTVIERKYVYNDLEVFRKSVIAVNPFLGNIPENMHNDYLMDFINEVRNLNFLECNDNNNEERVRVPYKLLVVVASKQSR